MQPSVVSLHEGEDTWVAFLCKRKPGFTTAGRPPESLWCEGQSNGSFATDCDRPGANLAKVCLRTLRLSIRKPLAKFENCLD
jgi:hypothetical protein